MRKLARAFAVVVLTVGVWQLVSTFKLVDPFLLPPPSQVGPMLYGLLGQGSTYAALGVTMYRLALGFLLATGLGIATGLVMGGVAWVREALEPTLDFLRSIPAAAFIPLALVVLGFGHASKIVLVVFSAYPVIAISTMYGVGNSNPIRLLVARSLGMSERETFLRVRLPDAAPFVFSGLRIALSISLVIVIVAEMFTGTRAGLGYRIVDAQYGYRLREMYAWIVLAGVLGYALNLGFRRLEKKVVHWAGRQ